MFVKSMQERRGLRRKDIGGRVERIIFVLQTFGTKKIYIFFKYFLFSLTEKTKFMKIEIGGINI